MHQLGEPPDRQFSTAHWFALGRCRNHTAMLGDTWAPVDCFDKHRRTPLWWAASCGNSSALTELLRLGAKPDKADLELVAPLHEAVRNGHVTCFKSLLEHGANPDLQDCRG